MRRRRRSDGDDDHDSEERRRSLLDAITNPANQTQSLSAQFSVFEESSGALGLCVLYFSIYIMLAVAVYSIWLEPEWTIIDSMYFAIVTFTTVGYGDLSPSTDTARLVTIAFALLGIVILGIFLGIVGHTLGEMQSRAVQEFEVESTNAVLNNLFSSNSSSSSTTVDSGGDSTTETSDSSPASLPATKKNPTVLQEVLYILRLESPILVVLVGAAIGMGYSKGWTIIKSLYFCVITLTTVGYGDLAPDTQLLRGLALVFLPVAVAVFGEVVGQVAGVYVRRKNQSAQNQFLHRSLTLCDMIAMDTNHDELVSREEFLTFMLVALQKVDQESIDQIMEVFNRLDVDKSGEISKQDLIEIHRRRGAWKKHLDDENTI